MEGTVSVAVRRRVSGESHESIGTVPAAGASAESRHPYYPSLDIDWIMRFKDDKLEAEYQRYIKENRHPFAKWVIFFVLACSIISKHDFTNVSLSLPINNRI